MMKQGNLMYIQAKNTPKNISIKTSTRNGGFSTAPCDSLNMGYFTGDDVTTVIKNYYLYENITNTHNIVTLNQVHGNDIIEVNHNNAAEVLFSKADGLFTDEYNSSRMIMKEFYPVSDREEFEIKRDGTRLRISEETAGSRIYQNMLDGFRCAFHIQAELSDSRAMEVMVRPYHMAEYGDSVYILSDMHLGTVLSRSLVTSLSDKLWLMYRTAEAVQLLNEQGYLYIDLNPSNILWIPSQKAVKLFDVDSIIPLHDLDKVHKIRVTYPYTPPEVEELIEWFDVNKSVFLKPSWDVYCLGLIFSELLTGEIPTAEALKIWQENEYKTEQICRQHGCDDPEAAALMKKILTRALSRKFRMRYPSAKEMCQDLNRLKMLLDAQEFIPKKEYAQANYMMESYHILEKWPVYEYTVKEEGKEILDVAVCGDQPMREPFFKAVFSCVH